jgi:hypothetical protein
MNCTHCKHEDIKFRAVKLEGNVCSWCGFIHPPDASFEKNLTTDTMRGTEMAIEAMLVQDHVDEERADGLSREILKLVLSRLIQSGWSCDHVVGGA